MLFQIYFILSRGLASGGRLSTGLYKVYQDGSINQIADVEGGYHIGDICCAVPTCADDSAPMSEELPPLQSQVSTAEDCSIMEEFLIQPDKSVVLPVPCKAAEKPDSDIQIMVADKAMPVVTQTMHMGIMRSPNSQKSAVQVTSRTLEELSIA